MRLAISLALLTAPALAEGIPVGVYEVLETYPKCSGPGKIAYRATFDADLSETDYFRYSDGPTEPLNTRECSVEVSVRRGTDNTNYTFPCAGVEEAHSLEKESMKAFCSATDEIGDSHPRRVASVHVKGALVGCLSLDGHELIDGTWEATSPQLLGPKTLSGAFDDPAIIAMFRPQQKNWHAYSSTIDGKRTDNYEGAVHILGTTTSPPQLILSLTINNLSVPQVSDGLVGVVGKVAINMVEDSNKACIENPESCFEKTYSVVTDLTATEGGAPLACERPYTVSFPYPTHDGYGPLADYYLSQPGFN